MIRLSQVKALQTDRQTDATENITTPHYLAGSNKRLVTKISGVNLVTAAKRNRTTRSVFC